MIVYYYTAQDALGETERGTIEAPDWPAAQQVLAERGLLQITAPLDTSATGETLGRGDTVELARYLTELSASGLPLDRGLRAVAKELPSGALARAMTRLAAQLEGGQSLQSALESFGARLPEHLRVLMVAGARSGNLAQTLDQVLAEEGQLDDLARQARQAVGYPLTLLAFLIGWMLFATLAIQSLDKIYEDFSTEPPPVTRHWSAFSRVFPNVVLAAGVLLLALLVLGRTRQGAVLISRAYALLPWIGPTWSYRGLVGFCGLLGVFLRQEMSLSDALRLTGLASRDAAIGHACGQMAEEVAAGRSLSACLAERTLFPQTLVQTIAWGENHRALTEVCQSAKQMFLERLELQAELVRLVLPPIVFVTLAGSCLFAVAGLFGGVFRLLSAFS